MSHDPERLTYSLNRREVMIKGIAGALAVSGFWSNTGTVFASVPGVTHGETPGLEEGPFWVDGQVERSDVRTSSSTGVDIGGLPVYLGLTISQLSDKAPYTIKPLVGARVDIWNASAQGVYSAEASESTTSVDYHRGYQISNTHGNVNFLTHYPGWYSGRTAHIHIRVRTYSGSTVTYNYATQLFFDDNLTALVYADNTAYARTAARDTYNSTDRVLNGAGENGSPAKEAGDYTFMKLANDGTHVQATFHMVLDLQDSANADPTNGTENTGGMGNAITVKGTAANSQTSTTSSKSGATRKRSR